MKQKHLFVIISPQFKALPPSLRQQTPPQTSVNVILRIEKNEFDLQSPMLTPKHSVSHHSKKPPTQKRLGERNFFLFVVLHGSGRQNQSFNPTPRSS